MQVQRGRVKWFNNAKGYGFINVDTMPKTDVFVHFSVVEGTGYKSLNEGDIVEIETRSGPKGLQASRCLVVGHEEPNSYVA